MKTRIIICFLLIIVHQVGCQKRGSNDQIIGKWVWIKTINPFEQIETNPQTIGFTMSLEFLPNETIKEFRNDTLINTANYHIETSNTGQLRLISSIITSNFSYDKDSLIFNEAFLDGPIIWYIKIKK